MKLSFRHAYQPGKLLTVHAQVKSGISHRSKSSNANTLTLNIDRTTLATLSGSSTPGLVVWVPPKPMDRLYWYANDPRRPLKTPAKLSRDQYVRPSIRYDITRLCTYASWAKSFSRQTTSQIDERLVHSRARQAYAALKIKSWNQPLVGDLDITRLAWRHITRQSKSTQRRILSLRVVPYLKTFLDQAPDRYICDHRPPIPFGRRTVETRYVLCWYRGALSIASQNYSLLLRIKEEISYPTDWSNHALGIGDIQQNATLASWWCKKEG